MKKNLILFCLLVFGLQDAFAVYSPLAKWMLFNGSTVFNNNILDKDANFGGANEVTAIAEDNAGNKIFGVAGKGIFKYDGKKMLMLKMPKDCYAATSDIISLACDSKNIIWVGTAQGLVKCEGETFTNIPFESTKIQVITNIVLTASDKVYISGLVMGDTSYVGGGLSFFNGADWTNMNKSNSDMPDGELSELMLDSKGHLWAIPGKNDMGVAKYDGKNWKHFTNGNGLSSNFIHAITTNKSGKVWLGSPKGVMEYNGSEWTTRPFTNGFSPKLTDYLSRSGDRSSLDISALAVEDNGTVWIGTRNMGLISLSQGGLKVLSQENSPILGNAILKISIDKDANKWMVAGYKNTYYCLSAPHDAKNRNHTHYTSGYGGVTVYKEHSMINNPKWVMYDSTTCPMDLLAPMDIAEDKNGTIWLPTAREGLVEFKDGNFKSYKHPKIFQTSFNNIYIAPDSKIYVTAGIGGIKVFENGVVSDFAKNPNMGGANDLVYDKDNILWASGSGGLSRYVNNDWETFNKKDGLPSIIFYCVFRDSKNMLWAGSAKGLVKFDSSWKHVDKDMDLPSNDFNAMAEDASGKLWLATNKGISMYDGSTFTNINKVESLKLKNFRVTSILTAPDNVIWMGTSTSGLLRYDGSNWMEITKTNSGPVYDEITAIHLAKDGKLYIASQISDFASKDYNLPSQDPIELQQRAIMEKIKLADPKKILTIYNTK